MTECHFESWEFREIAGRVWQTKGKMCCVCPQREGFFRFYWCQGYDSCPYYLEEFIYLGDLFSD